MKRENTVTISLLTACLFVAVSSLVSPTVGLAAGDSPIPKFLLIKLTRDQASAMCTSEVFTECMEFSTEKCMDLSEQAIELCLGPLPDEIDPQTLQNSTLEECPQQIYKKEGLSEDKAKMCFKEAMDASSQ